MTKKLLAVLGAGALLVSLGAGCENSYSGETITPEVQVDMTTTTPSQTAGSEDLMVTATAPTAGTLMVKWTRPATVEPGTSFRVLHSANPEPIIPGAYWYERSSPDLVEAELPNVPSGHRYVRVCQYLKGECVQFSNTVEVDVP